MKIKFEIPTIEKVSFKVSDSNLCNPEDIRSGVSTDMGIFTDQVQNITTKVTD